MTFVLKGLEKVNHLKIFVEAVHIRACSFAGSFDLQSTEMAKSDVGIISRSRFHLKISTSRVKKQHNDMRHGGPWEYKRF